MFIKDRENRNNEPKQS